MWKIKFIGGPKAGEVEERPWVDRRHGAIEACGQGLFDTARSNRQREGGMK